MIRRILVALDGSPRAPGVLTRAVEIASRFGARLQPFRAIFVPPEFPPAAAVSVPDPLPARLSQRAREELAHIVAGVPAGTVAVDPPIIRVGEPWRLIVDVSEEIDADLVVLGSHGYHGLDRILGTTAGRVSNMASRDVLVVHSRPDVRAATDPAVTPYR